MHTRRDLLRATLPAAAFAVGGGTLGLETILAATAPAADGVAAALDRVLPELTLTGVPFSGALEMLADTGDIKFVPDWPAIEAAGVRKDAPIEVAAHNTKLSKVIDLVLHAASGGKAKLGYAVANGVINVSTLAQIREAAEGYFASTNFYADGEWNLPKLPYAYDALEPHIDAKTMELHHGKHHAAYVANLNKAVKAMKDLPDDAAPGAIESLQRDISFNLGGHTLHSMFWGTIGKTGDAKMGGEPDGKLADAINAQFGSFAKFRTYFSKVATSIKGSGWAILAYSPISQTLVTYALKDQDSTHAPGTMPILGVDVWEHAYYLKYQNDRAAYVKAWWETINWDAVSKLMSVHAGH